MRHTLRIETWGHDPVLVCETCTQPGQLGTAVLRADPGGGLSLRDVVRAAYKHDEAVR